MCGICGYISFKDVHDITKIFNAFITIKDRGPDRSDFKIINEFIKIYLGFHRLAIMDRSTYGDQPFTFEFKNNEHRSIYVICNGEIYNFKNLVQENDFGQYLRSNSDCEFLPLMYVNFGFREMLNRLRGEFAIALLDINHTTNKITVHLGRDQTAVRPIFIGFDDNGFAFSSVLKGIIGLVSPESIRQVKRAEMITLNINQVEQKDSNKVKFEMISEIYHSLDAKGIDARFVNDENKSTIPAITFDEIHAALVDAVILRLESDRPIGALLSGGLDSSLVVSIAASHLRKKSQTLRTFSIGIPGSTDREYALMVSKHCNTNHTHVEFTEKEFLDAIPEVISAIESYDVTSVRASVGQFLISKWIKQNTDIRVLIIGDGSDELCSGYMYFHNAPNPESSHLENVRLVEDIQYFDVLRADRCIAYNGIEARVPFLDVNFVDLYLSIPHEYRVPTQENENGRKIEKWLLRKSFDRYVQKSFDQYVQNLMDDEKQPYLPTEVLWRKKEAFSDGVSSKQRSWYQIIQDNVETMYDQSDFQNPDVNIHLKPFTKEGLHYRRIFNDCFHPKAASVIPYYWMPKWSGNITDPSARVLTVYEA
jgi:asparagine synthase (glutamine-hydrolysing)